MSKDILHLLRPHILGIKPYSSARTEYSGEASIMLDANENAFGSVVTEDHNRYPDPLQKTLKKKIGTLKGVSSNFIFLGNGSDEPIDLLIRAFCEPGKDNILLLPPTYGMYVTCAAINNVEARRVLLQADFQPDITGIREKTDQHSKILFICSPNNPTGNAIHPEIIKILLDTFPGIVVIDEAYSDFSEQGSWIHQLEIYPNLVVLQTFSKAWGMADIRLGMAFSQPALINVLNNIKPPYNISSTTQVLASDALDRVDRKEALVREIIIQRELLKEELATIPLVKEVFPSDANYLLVKVYDADSLYHFLTHKGIVVRNRSKEPLCENCLRITVGTPYENGKLLEALSAYPEY